MISLFFLKNTKNKSANVLLNTLTFADIHSWLGYCDSNTGMSESESDALPLGDTPITLITNELFSSSFVII